MPWNPTAPIGSISVKSNQSKLNENMLYIQTTMGNSVAGTNTVSTRDHFWNVSSNLDGRHRFIQSPAFTSTVVTSPTNTPEIGTGMDGVMYLRTTVDGSIQGFYRNARNINQFIPALHTGNHTVTASYTNISLSPSLPNDCYGEIFMYRNTTDKLSASRGFFKCIGGVCEAWAYYQAPQGAIDNFYTLKYANGSQASGLNIRVRTSSTAGTTPGNPWRYVITYRDI